jgi:hypothetical protein
VLAPGAVAVPPRGARAAQEHADAGNADIDEFSVSVMSPYSLEAKLPKGTTYVALTKIQFTANSYVKMLYENAWLSRVKQPTMSALDRRLSAHRFDIMDKATPDVEIGFSQICGCSQDLLLLYRHPTKWHDTKDMTKALDISPPMERLRARLRHFQLEVAPDMSFLRMNIAMQQVINDGGDLGVHLSDFDMAYFTDRSRKRCRSRRRRPPARPQTLPMRRRR